MSLFADLTDVQRAAIADCLAAVTFKQGDVIIKQGQLITSTSKFYIVQEGQVDCFRTGWRVRKSYKPAVHALFQRSLQHHRVISSFLQCFLGYSRAYQVSLQR